MTKHERVHELMKGRILHGDYSYKEIPTERELAVETGVSRMTARRALQLLLGSGLVDSKTTGRLEVRRGAAGNPLPLRIALLSPSFQSGTRDRWRVRLDMAVAARGWIMRPLTYMHWDDAVIGDALNGFDGAFIHTSSEPIPARVANKLAAAANKVVALDDDLTHLGLPSVGPLPAEVVHRLLDHMSEQGCQRIACLNIQSMGSAMEGRINQWRIWNSVHGRQGALINEPVRPYEEALPQAFEVMRQMLATGSFQDDAVLCTTLSAARGCIRALYEAGRRVGVDVHVCSVDADGSAAALHVPSITSLDAPDAQPFVDICLDWMAAVDMPWDGPLLMVPQRIAVAVRESTTGGIKEMSPVCLRDLSLEDKETTYEKREMRIPTTGIAQ